MTEVNRINSSEVQPGRGGKKLTFELLNASYGIEITKVREIIGMRDIIPVPRTPEFILGVMNLRGTIIPVLDLRMIFDLPRDENSKETRIVVVEMEDREVGLIVDRVCGVLDIEDHQVEDSPEFGDGLNTSFVLGMAMTGTGVTALLDLEEILNSDQCAIVGALSSLVPMSPEDQGMETETTG